MAAGRAYYAVERWGRRDGYVLKDVEGRVPGGGTADPEEGGDGDEGKGGRGPEVLGSSVVGEEVLGRWGEGCEVCLVLFVR